MIAECPALSSQRPAGLTESPNLEERKSSAQTADNSVNEVRGLLQLGVGPDDHSHLKLLLQVLLTPVRLCRLYSVSTFT